MTNNWNRKETNASPSENKPRRSANFPESPPQKRASLISFIGQKVQKTVDERADAKQNQKAAHAARAEQAGNLITRGQFGCHYIEIYENGYVRIAASQDELKGAFMTKIAPFEKLLAFSFSEESGTKNNAAESSTNSLLRAASSLVGKGLKAPLPGLAIQGASHILQKKLDKKSTLTITTDHEVHVIAKTNSEDTEVGQALAQAAQTILGNTAASLTAAPQPAAMPPLPPTQPSKASTADRLRELAALHDDGVLDDAEFAAAKAKILGIL
jgi:hypothetical protein